MISHRSAGRPDWHGRRCSWVLGVALLLLGCVDSTGPATPEIVPETVASGIHHTCGLTTQGVMYCWGRMMTGQPEPPEPLAGAPAFRQVTAGVGTSCGLTAAGQAYCWGMNQSGQVGDGTTVGRTVPTPVTGGLTFTRLTTGILHSCGLTPGGTAYCWGFNSNGQLGDGTTENRSTPTPVAGGLVFDAIDTYNVTTCGRTAEGAVYCWGFNNGGQVGDGTTEPRLVPTRVASAENFTVIATGAEPCALTAAGAPYCWGGSHGLTPSAVQGAPALVSLSGGGGHTCGLNAAGAAFCWGYNASGQVGDGSVETRTAATAVVGGLTFAQISATGWLHTCGVTTAGRVYCWGYNADGQLGDGTTTARPVPAPTLPWGPARQ